MPEEDEEPMNEIYIALVYDCPDQEDAQGYIRVTSDKDDEYFVIQKDYACGSLNSFMDYLEVD